MLQEIPNLYNTKVTHFIMHNLIEYSLDKFDYFFISAIAFYSSFSHTYVKCKYNTTAAR